MEQRSSGNEKRGSDHSITMSSIPSILLSSIIFVLDRLTKYYVLRACPQQSVINRFVSIQPLFNRGISWGIFNTTTNWVFVIISCLIAIITTILAFYTYVRWRQGFWIGGECLVLAGSLSNIVDRIIYHGVLDFILLSFNGWSWPVFNIADMAIVIGVGIMIIQGYKEQ